MPIYAVAKGRKPGLYTEWMTCKAQIHGYAGALYKKFDTRVEAETFVRTHQPAMFDVPCEETPGNIMSFFKVRPKSPSIPSVPVSQESCAPASVVATDETECTPDYYVYTDGACVHNGRPNARAGIGVYFGDADPRNTSAPVEGKPTNNVAELEAILKAYALAAPDLQDGKRVTIVSDSTYAIGCATHYGAACAAKQWTKTIPNQALVRRAYETFCTQPLIRFLHVKAHTNATDLHSVGNAQADRLANEAVGVTECPYNDSVRLYLNVPYARKDQAKGQGARWDKGRKLWYIMDGHENAEALVGEFGRHEGSSSSI